MRWLAGTHTVRRRRSGRRDREADAVARRARAPRHGDRAAARDARPAPRSGRAWYARRAGGAESIPLPSSVGDVVTVAQAFHWFDQTRGAPRDRAGAAPRGRIALVWNTRDDRRGLGCGVHRHRRRSQRVSTRAVRPRRRELESDLYGPIERASSRTRSCFGGRSSSSSSARGASARCSPTRSAGPRSSTLVRCSICTPGTAYWRCRTRPSASAPRSGGHRAERGDMPGGAPGAALPRTPAAYFVGWKTAYTADDTSTLFAPSLT